MTVQKSEKTHKMFKQNNNLWHQYHKLRNNSFLGYNNQDELPVNKIIKYLEQKINGRRES